MSTPEWPHWAAVEMAGGVDLRGNSVTIDLGNGFIRVEPADPTRKFYADGAFLVDNLTREQLIEVLDRRRRIIRGE